MKTFSELFYENSDFRKFVYKTFFIGSVSLAAWLFIVYYIGSLINCN